MISAEHAGACRRARANPAHLVVLALGIGGSLLQRLHAGGALLACLLGGDQLLLGGLHGSGGGGGLLLGLLKRVVGLFLGLLGSVERLLLAVVRRLSLGEGGLGFVGSRLGGLGGCAVGIQLLLGGVQLGLRGVEGLLGVLLVFGRLAAPDLSAQKREKAQGQGRGVLSRRGKEAGFARAGQRWQGGKHSGFKLTQRCPGQP